MSESIVSEQTAQDTRTSPLETAHARHGAVMVEREGARVPAHYGDGRAEYEAVRSGDSAGLIDLSSRGRVEVSGAEAVPFLNGLITNDVKTLEDGAWMLAAFPNVQGRLLALARVARLGDTFHFDTEAATHAAVVKTLERFTLAGDFRVKDVTQETATLSVQGAGARQLMRATLGEEAASVERWRAGVAQVDGARVLVIRATHTAEDGFDIFCSAVEAEKVWESFVRAGARPVGRDALEVMRVEAGIARHGVDVDETNVVLEGAPEEAVSFTKGCYVGQEIIARIHWRGHVAKRLAGLVLETEHVVEVGSHVRAIGAEREIGRVTSSVFSPRLSCAVALGVVKYDYLKPGTEVQIVSAEGKTFDARVEELPLVRGSWYDVETTASTAEENT